MIDSRSMAINPHKVYRISYSDSMQESGVK